jgi:hypothetical protein
LARHLKNKHRAAYPNYLFCPHCKFITSRSMKLAEHLLNIHFILNADKVRYYKIESYDVKFYDLKLLSKKLLDHLEYYTFFNPDAPKFIN